MKIILSLGLILFGIGSFAKEDKTASIEKFIQQNKKVLVHVHANWCPSCKAQKKILEGISLSNFKLLEVDFDSDKEFLKKNKVFQQSMLIAFNNGKETARVFGITQKEKIMEFTDKNFNYSLQAVIDQKRAGSQIPSEARMTMEQATDKLRKSGIIDNAKKKGDTYIDFSLPNVDGKKVTLSEELKKGPIILTFYRGGWCPYCNLQLKAYQDHLEQFEAAGGQLIAVSPETMESGESTIDKNDLKFKILSDNLNKEARKYGLVFQLDEELKEVYLKFGLDLEKNQGNDSWELPIPATYVINKDGKIVYSFLNVDYVQRAEPADIIKALNSLK
ncbi:MAG: redoxin domain-containing protein [Bdellovibrionota bacterium]|nr:redoxin domain-containing protein [Bdellovibrionota bacterium]